MSEGNPPVIDVLREQRNLAMDNAANLEVGAIELRRALELDRRSRLATYRVLERILSLKELDLGVIQELVNGDPGFAEWNKQAKVDPNQRQS